MIAKARAVLDRAAPLAEGSHAEAVAYAVEDGMLAVRLARTATRRRSPDRKASSAIRAIAAAPSALLFRHNGLHFEVRFDREHPIGRDDRAGIADVVLESALTTIMDLEDSVAAVDAVDKVGVYRNWLGLVTGTLSADIEKGGRVTVERRLHADRRYTAPEGGEVVLPGRSLMLLRNVGHHMYTDAVLEADGGEIPEGMLDAALSALIAMHELGGRTSAEEQPRRIGLHREAEDARAGRGRARGRSVRTRRTTRRHDASHA